MGIFNHPRVMSLMAKSHELKPEITKRFELYVNNQELCNAYTELNDSVEQRQRFAEILKELEAGEHEAKILDDNFCEALEYGLPPTAGWGIGVDRLVMLLNYSQNIKIYFWSCVNPTFIINHPRVMSLMAKSHELVMKVGLTQLGTRKWSTSLSSMRDSHELKPEITERFELYVNNQELCNAYTELNDSVEQRQRFVEILKTCIAFG
ncbi:hypothetical protein V2J09_013856 [Rumex salicifolius]